MSWISICTIFLFYVCCPVIASPISSEKEVELRPFDAFHSRKKFPTITNIESACSNHLYPGKPPSQNINTDKVLVQEEDCSPNDVHSFLSLSEFQMSQLVIFTGQNTTLYKWQRPSDHLEVTIKKVDTAGNLDSITLIKREVDVLRQIKNAGIAPDFLCFFPNTVLSKAQGDSTSIYFMQQYIPGNSLEGVHHVYHPALHPDLNRRWAYIGQTMATLMHKLHKKGEILHLGLAQRENWIIDQEGGMYLVGWRLSRKMPSFWNIYNSERSGDALTKEIVDAPELQGVVFVDTTLTVKTDVLGLGVALASLYDDMVGYAAWFQNHIEGRSVNSSVSLPSPDSLLAELLDKDPKKRPSSDQVISKLGMFGGL